MDPEIKVELAEIKRRVIKIERYFFWTAVITILAVVLPLIGLLFAIPKFLGSYGDIQGLGL
jgi:lipopolysaccharide export LptBFGC system permease protein LptF